MCLCACGGESQEGRTQTPRLGRASCGSALAAAAAVSTLLELCGSVSVLMLSTQSRSRAIVVALVVAVVVLLQSAQQQPTQLTPRLDLATLSGDQVGALARR